MMLRGLLYTLETGDTISTQIRVQQENGMATVYGLYNYTKKERYYGTTKRELTERVLEHVRGQTEALDHWDWETDDIKIKRIKRGISPIAATRKAQALEKIKPPLGWHIIQTGGM